MNTEPNLSAEQAQNKETTMGMTETDLRVWFSFPDGKGGVYPFVEDENCNVHGYGHQDKAEFAAEVNRYDMAEGGLAVDEACWEASDITHRWAVMDPDGERFWVKTGPEGDRRPVTAETPGAFPITCLWNAR
ncbi:MAG TPA: hypothetical protein VGF17_15475 [Phytomonospora sp.]